MAAEGRVSRLRVGFRPAGAQRPWNSKDQSCGVGDEGFGVSGLRVGFSALGLRVQARGPRVSLNFVEP